MVEIVECMVTVCSEDKTASPMPTLQVRLQEQQRMTSYVGFDVYVVGVFGTGVNIA